MIVTEYRRLKPKKPTQEHYGRAVSFDDLYGLLNGQANNQLTFGQLNSRLSEAGYSSTLPQFIDYLFKDDSALTYKQLPCFTFFLLKHSDAKSKNRQKAS